VAGLLPWWEHLRNHRWAQPIVTAVNAATVGLILHVLYHPGWTLAIHGARDFLLLCLCLYALLAARRAPWQVALLAAGLASIPLP
jgi:chromate transporter